MFAVGSQDYLTGKDFFLQNTYEAPDSSALLTGWFTARSYEAKQCNNAYLNKTVSKSKLSLSELNILWAVKKLSNQLGWSKFI